MDWNFKGLDSVVFSIIETVKNNGRRRRKSQPEIWPDYLSQTAYQLLGGHLPEDGQWNWRNFYLLIFEWLSKQL